MIVRIPKIIPYVTKKEEKIMGQLYRNKYRTLTLAPNEQDEWIMIVPIIRVIFPIYPKYFWDDPTTIRKPGKNLPAINKYKKLLIVKGVPYSI